MNLGIIILIVILGLWGLGIFFGAIGGMAKAFHQPSSPTDSTTLQQREHQSIQDTNDKQKELMQDMKDKMDDMSHQ